MGDRAGQTYGKHHTHHRCFSRLDDAWCTKFGIEAAALGASESALRGTAPVEALHTFTLDSGASRCFFRNSTTLTPLSAPVPVRLADSSGSLVLARSFTVLPCPAVPSGSLSSRHLPSFSTNMVSTASLQDAMVTITTPGGQRVSICTCTRTGRHLTTFTRRPRSILYTVATQPPHVAAYAQVFASCPVAPPCSCRLLSHQTLLWHHHLGHPSLPRLRGMHSHFLVSGLPRSMPPLPPSPAPPCLPCVEGRQRAAPHSSSFPRTTAPLLTFHMDVWGPARVRRQGRERYFVLVVERFRQDLPVLRLHSDRGGEFSSNCLRDFCRGEGITQSFMLPASPHKNGIAERFIGLVIEVARTSMIHAAAPHFLWPFAVRYAAHQLKLWPRVSLPDTSPTLRWTGEVGDPSVLRVWGSHAFVCDTFADKPSASAFPCVFLGFSPDAPGWQFYHPTSRRFFPSQDVTFDESGAEPGGAEPGGAEPEGVEPGNAESEGAESGGAESRGSASSGAAGAGVSVAGDTGARGVGAPAGAGGAAGAAAPGPGGARTKGACSSAASFSTAPTVSHLLATVVTDPSFESTAVSALIAELVDFAATCRLYYATALVAESESADPPFVESECALGTDVLEDSQEDFECLAAAVPHFASMLLAPEGEPDAPDIPTPRSYTEAITGPYSYQWQAAMDAEMASWKYTCTYVDAVPPSWGNIVDGMWIFMVKRPPGSRPAFKARYIARGFTQRHGVDFFQTFSPTPKMTTLWVLQCFGLQFSLPQPTPLSIGHSLSAPPSDESVEPSGLVLVPNSFIVHPFLFVILTVGVAAPAAGTAPTTLAPPLPSSAAATTAPIAAAVGPPLPSPATAATELAAVGVAPPPLTPTVIATTLAAVVVAPSLLAPDAATETAPAAAATAAGGGAAVGASAAEPPQPSLASPSPTVEDAAHG
ncbi:unnamed protein product [Closterium sp. NIES-54]